jgi:hypothetical protein
MEMEGKSLTAIIDDDEILGTEVYARFGKHLAFQNI